MYNPRKLKTDINFPAALLPGLTVLVIFGFAATFIGLKAGLTVIFSSFLLFAVFSMVIFYRTKNYTFFAAALMQILIGLFFATVPEGILPFPDKKMAWFLYICGLMIGVWILILNNIGKGKWKGRGVFELASQSVELTSSGFTDRPKPSGKTTYSESELLGFAKFLQQNLVAMSFREETKIVFVPVKMGDEFSFVFSPKRFKADRSWVAFDYVGNITVCISKKDYLDYKEELSFDQLCDNLGKLFIDFMEYYKKGEEERILFKLHEVKPGFFS